MYYPTLNEVRKLRKHGNLVPIYREIVADLETPVSAYLKVARGSYSFLLESVEGGERLARYSFIGSDPYLVLKSGGEDKLDPLLLVEGERHTFVNEHPFAPNSVKTMEAVQAFIKTHGAGRQ